MAYNRHAAAKQDDEEYRGLLRSSGNDDAPSAATNSLRLMNRARAIEMRSLSTPTLIFSVFIMGALFGSLMSSSKRSSENHNVVTTILPSSLKEDDEIMKARDVHVSSMCRCGSQIPFQFSAKN